SMSDSLARHIEGSGPAHQERQWGQKEASLSEALWKLKYSCFQAKGKWFCMVSQEPRLTAA
ncbi:MAG TPA: hypothetical protein VFN35_35610, partial [Ktedonobacteraceae bacterium]|nr:hypothetical protein [Ktedonobacteraceae bacterium]